MKINNSVQINLGRFAASQMSDSIRETRNLVTNVNSVDAVVWYQFGEFTGWEIVYSADKQVQTEPPNWF